MVSQKVAQSHMCWRMPGLANDCQTWSRASLQPSTNPFQGKHFLTGGWPHTAFQSQSGAHHCMLVFPPGWLLFQLANHPFSEWEKASSGLIDHADANVRANLKLQSLPNEANLYLSNIWATRGK